MFSSYYDKVCVITGASSGIGAEFAKALARRGAKVVLFARRQDRMQAIVPTLYNPDSHLIVVGDAARADDRARLIQQTLEQYGRIDVLINNAGIGDGNADFAQNSAAHIEQMLMVNLVGAVLLTHAALPHMHNGLIINVSSPMGALNLPVSPVYSTTKAGLSAFSQALYRGLKQVHVLDLKPGFTISEMVTETQAKKLPRLVGYRTADGVVEEALHAALSRKPDLMTGSPFVRLSILVNRVLPRLVEMVFPFFMPKDF